MDKKTEKILKKNNLELDQYKLINQEIKADRYALYSYIAFGIILVLFLVDMLTSLDLKLNGFLVYIALSLLVIYPMTSRDHSVKEFLIITPIGLIKRVDKEVTFIEYDLISRYKFDDLNIYISKGRDLITLNRETYKDDLEILVDILEAKGKTFDPKKDYMVRDILVVIEDETIRIEDIEHESVTEKITGKLLKKYNHLTPGFINEIIPRNSVVNEVRIIDNHLDILVNTLQVKQDHPENTTFEMQAAVDCIFIFENARIVQYAVRESNDTNKGYQLKEVVLTDLTESLTNSVIDEWQYGEGELIFIFKAGLGNVKIHLKYDEVIIGWNKMK